MPKPVVILAAILFGLIIFGMFMFTYLERQAQLTVLF